VVPDFLSVVVGNLALLGGSALFYFGTQHFCGLAASWRLWSGVMGASGVVFTWFLLVEPSYSVRVVVFTALMATLFTAHAMVLIRHGPKGFSARFTTFVLLLQTCVLLARGISTLVQPAGRSMFDPSPVQTAYVATYALSILLVTIGVLLMATDRLRAEFEHLAAHDPLTGVLTRRALLEACDQELERSHRYGRPLALMMLDLDHFKAVNDNHGHQAGDKVLVDFVRRASAQLRKPDRLGRYGGEEFLVMLPETSLAEARIVAERILKMPGNTQGLPACTTSIGLAASSREDTSVDTVLARADAALYRAKAQGRSRVEVSA
jgi:diguanylate cyclase (GGDEF)-like protein